MLEDATKVVRQSDAPAPELGQKAAALLAAEKALHDSEGVRRTVIERRIVAELVLLCSLGVAVFGLAFYSGLLEPMIDWIWKHRATPLDEFFCTLIVLSPALGTFAYRRWKETRSEAERHKRTAAALRVLHAELEQRVRQRTDELAQSNEALRAEILERQELELEVRWREERLNSFFTGATAGLAMFDRDLRFIQINSTLAEMNGIAPADHVGRRIDEIVPDLAKSTIPLLEKVLATNQPILHVELTGETRRQPGVKGHWIESLFPIAGKDGKIEGVGAIVVDITERKRAEQRLQLQQAVTAVLAEVESQALANQRILQTLGQELEWDYAELWIVDRPAKLLRCAEIWHAPAANLKQFANLTRSHTFSLGTGLPGRVWMAEQAEWSSDVSQDSAFQRRTAAVEGGLSSWLGIPIHMRKDVVGVIGLFSKRSIPADQNMLITLTAISRQIGQFLERIQLAEQFRQAQKMEAIGTLAGGIAHDFNNIIAAITGYTELAQMQLIGNPTIAEYLNSVLVGANRAADLVRQILAFSRQQENERKPTQLRHVVAEAQKLLRATIPATIEFDVALTTDLPPVFADPTQIHQVVMNLCTNAWHAMKDRPGRLGLSLENWQVDKTFAELHSGLREGLYVRLSVSDTGKGMDKATLSRIFEPFFTTKAPGEGTGLGLAVVHGIMQSHEGVVTVYSQPGEGTTFQLYFPAAPGAKIVGPSDVGAIPRGNGERILYVDDEPLLTMMAEKVLQQLGYSAEGLTSPVDALVLFQSNPTAFDLFITDLAMPGISGTDLAQQVLTIRPDMPIILVTGFTASLTMARVQSMGIRELLLKPASVETLATTVQRVLVAGKEA